MRDKDTIETAITAAETGHLVFGTLHTGSASDAIDRMVQVFPEGMQNQIRLQLSMTLMAVISQQLVKKKTGGRVLASEVMVVTCLLYTSSIGGMFGMSTMDLRECTAVNTIIINMTESSRTESVRVGGLVGSMRGVDVYKRQILDSI